MPEQWNHDETIRASAEKFITENDLTQAQFTERLAGKFSTTRVAKYLNLDKADNKPEADAPKVEAAIRAFLRHVGRGAMRMASLYENSVTADMAGVLRLARRTGDIALIHSDGGKGKTCGALLFCRDNPDSLFVTAKAPWACSDWKIMEMIFEELQNSVEKKWNAKLGLSKWEWVETTLRGTERLLILDDAELMHVSAFRMLFSLHEATGIPMAFIGNNEVIEKIRAADASGKMISRIGIVHHARMKDDEEVSAKKLIAQFAPESGAELLAEVTVTITKFGHSRRARKQLTLAVNLRDGSRTDKDWLSNYRKAGEKLITVNK